MQPDLVKLTIDGVDVSVPKGTNLIEAAKTIGVEIPHYCYHPHLSVAGNCRMCQVQVEGMPKLTIACNTGATEGMVVHTGATSQEVADAQRATLEFILINHPLDCTVCDQAGHCKLQDYYYQYNRRPSRFQEDKEHKVKALPLGPDVILDGERCILCTRCVRFCEEVSGTGELGVLNRGDKSVISIYEDVELDNALSGSVVDLCPVGALTHRRWRFNTRIWFTEQRDTICPGCSTGCNVRVAVRDNEVVHVKARLNSEVNKEWLCNEGRYGFDRFVGNNRYVKQPFIAESLANQVLVENVSAEKMLGTDRDLLKRRLSEARAILKSFVGFGEDGLAVFVSPLLPLEDLVVLEKLLVEVLKIRPSSAAVAVQVKTRELDGVMSRLASPDYAPNARGAVFLGWYPEAQDSCTDGCWRTVMQRRYEQLLNKVRDGRVSHVMFVGDASILTTDADETFSSAMRNMITSLGFCSYGDSATSNDEGCNPFDSSAVYRLSRLVLPCTSLLERGGTYVNRDDRFQSLNEILVAPNQTLPEWRLISMLSSELGVAILPSEVTEQRDLLRYLARTDARLSKSK